MGHVGRGKFRKFKRQWNALKRMEADYKQHPRRRGDDSRFMWEMSTLRKRVERSHFYATAVLWD